MVVFHNLPTQSYIEKKVICIFFLYVLSWFVTITYANGDAKWERLTLFACFLSLLCCRWVTLLCHTYIFLCQYRQKKKERVRDTGKVEMMRSDSMPSYYTVSYASPSCVFSQGKIKFRCFFLIEKKQAYNLLTFCDFIHACYLFV
jgi:hypothetical protein